MIQYIQTSSLSTDGRYMVSCELVLVVWRGVVPNWIFSNRSGRFCGSEHHSSCFDRADPFFLVYLSLIFQITTMKLIVAPKNYHHNTPGTIANTIFFSPYSHPADIAPHYITPPIYDLGGSRAPKGGFIEEGGSRIPTLSRMNIEFPQDLGWKCGWDFCNLSVWVSSTTSSVSGDTENIGIGTPQSEAEKNMILGQTPHDLPPAKGTDGSVSWQVKVKPNKLLSDRIGRL